MDAPYSPGPGVRSSNSICLIVLTGLLCLDPLCPPWSPPARTLDGEGSRVLHTWAAEANQGPAVLVPDSLQDESVLQALVLHLVPQGPRLYLALWLITLELFPIKEPGALDDGGEIEGEDGIFPVIYLHVVQTGHQASCGH